MNLFQTRIVLLDDHDFFEKYCSASRHQQSHGGHSMSSIAIDRPALGDFPLPFGVSGSSTDPIQVQHTREVECQCVKYRYSFGLLDPAYEKLL